MLNDEPTLLDPLETPTLPDLRRIRPTKGPTWPVPVERDQRPSGRGRPPLGCMRAAVIGASIVLLLSLLGLLSVFNLTNSAGLFSRSRAAAQSTSAASMRNATPTATAIFGWLQVAPSSVRFGCADHQRTQTVVLENHGSHQIHWQASFLVSVNQSGVEVSPGDGDIGPGESTAIQLQATTYSASQAETIHFNSTDPEAGSPASLSFTTMRCG